MPRLIDFPTGRGKYACLAPLLLFAFGLAATALPLLAFRLIPTQDGGSHANTALVLAGLERDENSFLHRYFEVHPTPLSNQLASQIMAWCAEFGFSGNAERIVWLILLVAFSTVVVGNLWLMRRDAIVFSLLLFPIFAGIAVNLGFINYLFGLVMFCQSAFLLQFGLRRPSTPWVLGLLAASAATFVAHPLAGFALGATEGSFAVGYLAYWCLAGRRRGGPPFSLILPVGCAIACAALAALAAREALPQFGRFVGAATSNLPPSDAISLSSWSGRDVREWLLQMSGLSYFVSYSPVDHLFLLGYGGIVGWLAWGWAIRLRRQAGVRCDDIWIVSIAALSVVSVAAERRFEYYLPERLAACQLILVAIWLATTPLAHPARTTLLVAGLLLNSALLVWRLYWNEAMEPVLAEYASVGPAIPDHASVLVLRAGGTQLQRSCRAILPRRLPCGFQPSRHFMAEIVGNRPIALISNYQLSPQAGFFPVELRQPWNDYLQFYEIFVNWPPSTAGTGLIRAAENLVQRTPPDVIVTWDDRVATGDDGAGAALPMFPHYKRIFQSRPLGVATVYLKDVPDQRDTP